MDENNLHTAGNRGLGLELHLGEALLVADGFNKAPFVLSLTWSVKNVTSHLSGGSHIARKAAADLRNARKHIMEKAMQREETSYVILLLCCRHPPAALPHMTNQAGIQLGQARLQIQGCSAGVPARPGL